MDAAQRARTRRYPVLMSHIVNRFQVTIWNLSPNLVSENWMRHFTLMMVQRGIRLFAVGKLKVMRVFTYSVEILAMCCTLSMRKIIGKS